jgi:hypothetical protein
VIAVTIPLGLIFGSGGGSAIGTILHLITNYKKKYFAKKSRSRKWAGFLLLTSSLFPQ